MEQPVVFSQARLESIEFPMGLCRKRGGKGDGQHRSLVDLRSDDDVSEMTFHNSIGKGEPDSITLVVFCVVAAVKRLE